LAPPKGVWWYKIKFAGQVIRESSKSRSKSIAAEAERVRRGQLRDAYNGIEKKEQVIVFSAAGRRWLERRRPHIAPSTAGIYELALDHLVKVFGATPATLISAEEVADYQVKRLAEGAAARTINMETDALRAIIGRRAWGGIVDGFRDRLNRRTVRLKENRDVGRALKPAERENLLAVARQPFFGDCSLADIVTLALGTGMRAGEIKNLNWGQIDFEGCVLTVGDSKTETGTGRRIPLNDETLGMLIDRKMKFEARPEHFVFPACENHRIDPGRPIKSFRTAWRNAVKRAGIGPVRPHDLRHSVATTLFEEGKSLPVVAEIMGWSASTMARMAKRYSHISEQAKREAVEVLGRGAQIGAQNPAAENSARPN
jgi:integrase